MTKQLFPLALGGLAIGTTEFVIMGLLPDVSSSLNVSAVKDSESKKVALTAEMEWVEFE